MLPEVHVATFVDEQTMATKEHADDEEHEGLSETTMFKSPSEVYLESAGKVGLGHIKHAARLAWLCHDAPVFIESKIHRRYGTVGKSHEHVCYFYRLKKQYGSQQRQHPVRGFDKGYEQKSEYGIGTEDVAVEEHEVEHSPAEEQKHAPCKPQTEVFASLLAVVVLNVATESEEECKDGIHLTGPEIEHGIPQSLFESRRFGEVVEVEVFEEMNDDDANHGKAAKAVDNGNAFCGCLIHNRFMFLGCKDTKKLVKGLFLWIKIGIFAD